MPPTGTPPAAITPQGIRDGDPAVLAALAARRGPAVMAFASEICDTQYAVRATADAFARFRVAVATDDEATQQHPDALLLRCAHRAALDLAPRGPDLGCDAAVELLVQRAEKAIKPRDATLLSRHLTNCEHCRDLAAALESADRAYREADDGELEPATVAPIVAALAAAAPVRMEAVNGTAKKAAAPRAKARAKAKAAPETEAPAADAETPAPETEAPAADAETPAPETEAPAADAETPKAEATAAPEAAEAAEVADAAFGAEAADATAEPTTGVPPTQADAAHGDEPLAGDREEPLGTRRVGPVPYYQVPEPEARTKSRRRKRAAELRRRAGAAARKRLNGDEQAAAPADDDRAVADAALQEPADETRTWQPVESIEFPALGPMTQTEFEASVLPDPELRETSAKAAARHYRRSRHEQQERTRRGDGEPPKLSRPKRDKAHHLPLSAHGPRDLALPAGLVVLAALIVMAVSGVFGGGSDQPATGTQANAAPEVSMVSQSVTATSLADAERIAERSADTVTTP